jgi:hypothetical protein
MEKDWLQNVLALYLRRETVESGRSDRTRV